MKLEFVGKALRASCQFIWKKKFFSIPMALVIVVVSFAIGAEQYRTTGWPFGRGYWSNAIRLILPISPRAVSRFVNPGEELKSTDTELNTLIHNVMSRQLSELDEGQIEVLSETKDKIEVAFITLPGKFYIFTVERKAKNDWVLTSGPTEIGQIKGVSTRQRSRVTDFVPLSVSEGTFLVSYTHTDERECATLKLDRMTIAGDQKSINSQENIFTAEPCVLPPYGLHETGGRIVLEDENTAYMTVGDFQHSYQAQDPKAQFGKIIKFDLLTSKAEIYSSGHRNPQGLFFDTSTGTLISTEHGPEAGDEINIIEESANYGWPSVTYGTPYHQNPEAELYSNKGSKYGYHEGFKKPLYVFTPSIAIAQIRRLGLDSSEFPQWRGDYLVAGMKAQALFRIKVVDGRVMFIEPIESSRFRDFDITKRGIIFASGPEGIFMLYRLQGGRG